MRQKQQLPKMNMYSRVITTQLKALKVKQKIIELHYITKIHMALRDGNWKDSDCEVNS